MNYFLYQTIFDGFIVFIIILVYLLHLHDVPAQHLIYVQNIILYFYKPSLISRKFNNRKWIYTHDS